MILWLTTWCQRTTALKILQSSCPYIKQEAGNKVLCKCEPSAAALLLVTAAAVGTRDQKRQNVLGTEKEQQQDEENLKSFFSVTINRPSHYLSDRMSPLQLSVYWRLSLVFIFTSFLFFLDIFSAAVAAATCHHGNASHGTLPSNAGGNQSRPAEGSENEADWKTESGNQNVSFL